MSTVRIMPAGDAALVAQFDSRIDPVVNDQVHTLAEKVQQAEIPGIRGMIPAFCSLVIQYDPHVIRYDAMRRTIEDLAEQVSLKGTAAKRILEIPCCYGSHFGPDLHDMEVFTGLTRDEIIARHSGVDYRVYMLGFLPGFVYLGGLDRKLEMPRLKTPRLKIPGGAVGIGGNQTGVYPLDSPGGWRLIGATPVDFYDPCRQEPVLCKAGDYIRFVPVTSCEYYDIRQMILRGTYTVKVHEPVRL